MMAQVSVAELPGGDGRSEDRVFATGDAVVVLDGVGSLDPDCSERTGWYPQELGRRIVDLLTPEVKLREVVAAAIGDVAAKNDLQPGSAPAATVTIVRWTDAYVEGLVLGDSPIIVFGTDGGVDVLRDGRHDAVVADLRRQVRRERGLQARDGQELQALIRATRPGKLAQMNTPGGYWIAEAVPEAGLHAIVRTWHASSVEAFLAVTDGVSCGIEDYGIPSSWLAALDLARRNGLATLLAAIHQAEAQDPGGQRWPRPKTHDDKAAALILLDGQATA
jgi:Protein phosphatase 2C